MLRVDNHTTPAVAKTEAAPREARVGDDDQSRLPSLQDAVADPTSPGILQWQARLRSRAMSWKALGQAHTVLLIGHPDIVLPDRVVQSLMEQARENKNLRFEVRVNQQLKSSVQVDRFKVRGLSDRAFVSAYWLVMQLARKLGDTKARTPWHRGRRVLSRQMNRVAGNAMRLLYGTSTASDVSLSKYVLTDCLHVVPEFQFPVGVHLALTKNCNLKCIMCPYHADELRAQHSVPYFKSDNRMPPAVLERILEEAGKQGASITFGQYDEPFIYKGFAKWAARAKALGCSVSVTTNGTLLDEEDARIMLEAGVEHISFSLDAASPESYRKIRLDDFSVPIENLRRLVKLRNEGKFKTTIRACMVLQEHNRHEVEAFSTLMDEIGIDLVSFYNLTILDNGIWRMPVLNFDIKDDMPGERNVCSQLYNQVAIYPDGQVALCCLTTMYVGYRQDVPYVGNVKTQTIRDIWLSEPYLNIRREAFEKKFANSVCRDCTIWHNYQGRETIDEKGRKVYVNAYEKFVYLR